MKNIKNIGKKRGFSLTEVVVAMAVIVIVTGASILLVGSYIRAHAETVDNIHAANIAENAIECFRYAENNDENNEDMSFESVFFEKVLQMDVPQNEGDIDNPSYEFESNGVDVTITIIDGNTIKVKAGNIEEKTFTKH